MKLYQPFNSGELDSHNLTEIRNRTKLTPKDKIISFLWLIYIWVLVCVGCSL